MTERGPPLARLARPRTDRPVRLAVVADPHVTGGHGTWKVAHRSHERLATAVEVAREAGVDATLLAGDLTGDGRRGSFEAVDDLLTDLPEPWVGIPGNHDVPKTADDHGGLSVAAIADRYAPSGSYPFAAAVGPVTVLGVDTASASDGSLRHTWGGRVGDDQRRWLADALAAAETPVVLAHHNVATLPENPGGKWLNFPLRDATAVRDVLVDGGAPLVVSGHHHVPAVAGHAPGSTAVEAPSDDHATVEVLAPAACSYPQAMLLLEVGPEGTTVRLVPLADREGVREARRYARRGKPLGVGVLGAVERRLGRLPLIDARAGEPET